MSKQRRKSLSAKAKAEIMKAHFSEGLEISALCEKYKIQPVQFYRWKKEFIDNAESVFETKKRGLFLIKRTQRPILLK